MSNMLDTFPASAFRKYQDTALREIQQAYEDGYKAVILSAPTGFGKSPVNIAVARYFSSAYYITPLKSLQDQLDKDALTGQWVANVKGRNAYNCVDGTNASTGYCIYNSCVKDFAEECEAGGAKRFRLEKCSDCPCMNCEYERAKARAFNSHIMLTNTTFFVVYPNIPERDVLIMDECQNLHNDIARNIEIQVRDDELDNIKFPHYKDDNKYIEWIETTLLPAVIQKREYVKEKIKDSLRNHDEPPLYLRKLNARLGRLETKIKKIDAKIPWVATIDTKYDKRKRQYVEVLKFKPVVAYKYIKQDFLSKANFFVFSSGTPPQPKDLGLEEGEYKRIEIPSTFKLKNRQIKREYAGKMSMKARGETIPKMAAKIDAICREYNNEQVIVHCHAYKIARDLSANLKTPHILQEDRERDLQRFIDGEKQLYLSVNMDEGIDLKDDLARINILAKIPFPYLGSRRVQKRRDLEGDDWMKLEVAKTIQQSYGRAVRSDTDWAIFYIMDSDFGWWWKQNKNLVEKWFKDAVKQSFKKVLYKKS